MPRPLAHTKAALVTLLALSQGSCAALSKVPTKDGCQIVDAAHKACVLLRFLDPQTGQVTEVKLSPEEASEMGRAAVARQKSETKGVLNP